MKTASLLFVFAIISIQAFGQYARSIYTDDSPQRRFSSVFSANGQTTILSIRESSNDTLRVMLINIDDLGETDNYRMFEYSPFDVSGSFALSGIGTNAQGAVSLCVLNENATQTTNIRYITLNPSTGTFSNDFSINGVYKRGYTRSRQKGDSLITYVGNFSTGGITRMAKSLSSTTVSTELAVASGTYYGSIPSNNIGCELLIDGTDEYIATPSDILKRNSINNYLSAPFMGLLQAPMMTVNTSGNLFVATRGTGSYELFDGNLFSLSAGTIPELQGSMADFHELYSLPNDGIRVWSGLNQPGKVIDLDASLAVVNEKITRNAPGDVVLVDGKRLIVGFDRVYFSNTNENGQQFLGNPSNITVVYDDLSNDIPDFIEYDQTLTNGNIEFHTNHLSRSFSNSDAYEAGFRFEQNGLKRPVIYTTAANIIGTDQIGNLKGTTNNFPPTQVPGPYCPVGNYSKEMMDQYSRGYYVTRDMIEMHLFEITAGNPNYVIPFGIREWPAHGDISLGQAANLARFIDQNSNGTYEPELGDYPAIYGDQCLLNIYHQHANTANSASIETHQYYFTFDCDSSETLKNTVFVRTDNFARNEILYNTYEGDFTDFDIGNPSDDYLGTHVELGMTYCYNGDLFDENSAGTIGFQDTIPAVGMIALQGFKLDDDGIDNFTTIPNGVESNGIGFSDGIADNEYFTMESSYAFNYWPAATPTDLANTWNVMTGLNPDGTPKTANGVDIRHEFFGNSDPNFYTSSGIDHGNNHSEIVLNNPAGDRRIMSASGSGTLDISDTLVLLKAFVVGVDTVNVSLGSSLPKLFEHGQNLRDYFDQNTTPCGNSFDSYVSSSVLGIGEEQAQQIMVYPNPAHQQIQFRGISGAASVTIFDLNGRVVISESAIFDDQEIDISPLEKSIYIIQISDENGMQTIRMVKQ